MKLINLTVQDFIDEVDSKSPAPGGGSVSALISALGTALVKMVGHLSISKKKFLKLDEAIQKQIHQTMAELDHFKKELVSLIDQDTIAFNQIMKAYQLPKETDEQLLFRHTEIQLATQEAISVPMKVLKVSRAIFYHLSLMLTYGTKQAVSDIGVGILSIATGAEGAGLNVLINACSLEDEAQKKATIKEVKKILQEITDYKTSLMRMVYHIIEKE